MPQKLADFVLPLAVTLLALSLPGKAVAGPPEGVSGKMVLLRDDITDGLRKYRKEKELGKRIVWLEKLAPTQDPREAIALGEAMNARLGTEPPRMNHLKNITFPGDGLAAPASRLKLRPSGGVRTRPTFVVVPSNFHSRRRLPPRRVKEVSPCDG